MFLVGEGHGGGWGMRRRSAQASRLDFELLLFKYRTSTRPCIWAVWVFSLHRSTIGLFRELKGIHNTTSTGGGRKLGVGVSYFN